MKWLLRLYPPRWQHRFRDEVAAHLEEESSWSLRTAVDLIAGAVDAWRHPEWFPEASPSTSLKGEIMKVAMPCCEPVHVSREEARQSSIEMIVISLLLVSTAVVLDKAFGDSIYAEALIYSSFFIALTISSRRTYFKGYSREARNLLTFLGAVVSYAFFLGVAALAVRI